MPAFLRRSIAPPALNPALTFDTFVAGDENRMALDAARRAVAAPGVTNPLTIYGPAGLGKTHLLSAIGHAAYAQGRNVIYAPAERFGNDYVRALGGKLEAVPGRYRTADLLLIDDVQFLEGKEKFQDEFFHTFNDLHAAGKQIVVCGDRMPAQMTGLSDALRSRLQVGVSPPTSGARPSPRASPSSAPRRSSTPHSSPKARSRPSPSTAASPCAGSRATSTASSPSIPLVGGHITPDAIAHALALRRAAHRRRRRRARRRYHRRRRRPPHRRHARRPPRPQPQPRRSPTPATSPCTCSKRTPATPSPRSAATSATATTAPSSPASPASPASSKRAPRRVRT